MDAIRPEDPTDPHRTILGTAGWVLAALAVLAGGLLHLKIWNSDYRDLPKEVPGWWVVKVGFPVNAASSVVIALALALVAFGAVVALRRFIVPAALALEVGSIAALVQSRRGTIFRWSEKGWTTNAKQVLIVEIVGTVLLVIAAMLPAYLKRRAESV
ncbi:MAG: hypothetical protein ACR2MB_17495 [Acidimicrobiales bacterium]